MAKKVATYCRVSMSDNAPQTLAQQHQKLQEYAEKHGYEICHTSHAVGNREVSKVMFLKCLRDAKEHGADTVLMASTNRVAGTVDEMQAIREAYEASGLAIETLDGSHMFPESKHLVADFIMSVAAEEDGALDDEDTALVFGYDVTSDGWAINQDEADVVKYIFDKVEEYTTTPPEHLVQEVVDEYAARGEEISAEEAAGKVFLARITNLVEAEVKEKWPEQYESMLYKQCHNHANHRAIHEKRDAKMEPVIDRDTWEKAQEVMRNQKTGGMTLS